MSVKFLTGDCRELLKSLPDESVHCVVTSPPYWGLRDYGVAGQMGMEQSLGEHVSDIADVFDEVRRVLRSDGTLWLNYGDSYATSVNGRSAADTKAVGNDDRTFRDKPFSTIGPINRGKRAERGSSRWGGGNNSDATLKPKDLCGIPWRIAFALQERGWWLRQDIIWSKLNPMPESVADRCTKAHEYLFLMAKSERYYFDGDAISEPAVEAGRVLDYTGNQKNNATDAVLQATRPKGREILVKDTRNKRSVWTVTTQPFSEAHFATFPPALIEPCILAGCPKGGMVLDPFGGAGTTGLVADRLQRNAILIELNPVYVQMAERRLHDDAGMFLEAAMTS